MAFCDQGFHFKPVGDHEYGWEMTHGMPVAALNRGGLMLLVVLAVLDRGCGWKVEIAMAGNGVAWGVAGRAWLLCGWEVLQRAPLALRAGAYLFVMLLVLPILRLRRANGISLNG